MASLTVSNAVSTYLAANFSTCPVFALNEQMEPPIDGRAFVQVQYPIALEEQQSIGDPGNNVFREEGAIRFVVNAPVAAGIAEAATLADELRTLFRNKRFDGVHTFEAPPITLDDNSDRAGYFQGSFAVAYEFDIRA